eukprot:5809584-Pleurochrysis_carterae.AAC.2
MTKGNLQGCEPQVRNPSCWCGDDRNDKTVVTLTMMMLISGTAQKQKHLVRTAQPWNLVFKSNGVRAPARRAYFVVCVIRRARATPPPAKTRNSSFVRGSTKLCSDPKAASDK